MIRKRWLSIMLVASVALGACGLMDNRGAAQSKNAKLPSNQEPNNQTRAPMSIRQEGESYYLSHGAVTVEVTPSIGGRIASLKHDGRELLLERAEGGAWGNVLWPSPQSDWGWPPLAVLDSGAYQVEQQDNRLVVTSGIEPGTGYQFSKGYYFDRATGALVLDYEIHNRGSRDQVVAPWEVTRVPPEGLAFFPTGKTESISGFFEPLPVETGQGITWYRYDPDVIVGNHKLMADGAEGWLAYINAGMALIKQFPDVPAALNVPGEGEIELYTDEQKTLIEVEQQGPLTRLAPGESLAWQVRWHVEPVPDALVPEVGNMDLVAWTRSLVHKIGQ